MVEVYEKGMLGEEQKDGSTAAFPGRYRIESALESVSSRHTHDETVSHRVSHEDTSHRDNRVSRTDVSRHTFHVLEPHIR